MSTTSKAAITLYYEGWHRVMDRGDYTGAEAAYRDMVNADPYFILGLSLLGRITRDLSERTKIEETLESRKNELSGDERKLLDNYLMLVKLTNIRESEPEKSKAYFAEIFPVIENTQRELVHQYPDDIYYKAEYIEVLHINYGAQAALDSMQILCSEEQLSNPFLLGFAAKLQAEQGNYKQALSHAQQLKQIFRNDNAPKPYVVYADIYLMMGKEKHARKNLQQALALDPGNIDAQRLQEKIKALQ